MCTSTVCCEFGVVGKKLVEKKNKRKRNVWFSIVSIKKRRSFIARQEKLKTTHYFDCKMAAVNTKCVDLCVIRKFFVFYNIQGDV